MARHKKMSDSRGRVRHFVASMDQATKALGPTVPIMQSLAFIFVVPPCWHKLTRVKLKTLTVLMFYL